MTKPKKPLQEVIDEMNELESDNDLLEEMEEAEGETESKGPPRLDKHDPKRSNFCGTSWGDANQKCEQW